MPLRLLLLLGRVSCNLAAARATATTAPPPCVPPVVAGLTGEWTEQPMRVPSNQTVGAPIIGNGGLRQRGGRRVTSLCQVSSCARADGWNWPRARAGEFGVVVGGAPADNNLTFFLGSNQFWAAPTGGISQCGFRDGDNLYFELGERTAAALCRARGQENDSAPPPPPPPGQAAGAASDRSAGSRWRRRASWRRLVNARSLT